MTCATTSMQRVLTSLGHQEPDRVPFFLPVTMHPAGWLGLSLHEYFSQAENVVEGQLRVRDRLKHDFYYGFFYASLEYEAWGGESIFREDGPPNSGEPILKKSSEIINLESPRIRENRQLCEVLRAIEMLKSHAGEQVPIVGVAISPFSLPVMQMGFDHYIDLIFEQPDLFEKLMQINEEFCVAWSNAQLSAGATAICYFDPVSSTTIIPPELYLKTGFRIAQRTIKRIQGPTVTHFASGRCFSILPDVMRTGTAVAGISVEEDLAQVKAACKGKLSILGNLNALEMRHWTAFDAEERVKNAIAGAGIGGGYILSDNHGEIPLQVPEETLFQISEAVQHWGSYPLNWVDTYGK